jgi:hypothetical protein
MERVELNLTLMSFARATLILFGSLSCKQYQMAVSEHQIAKGAF